MPKLVGISQCGELVGAVCVNTGTIPGKTLREALTYLSGLTRTLRRLLLDEGFSDSLEARLASSANWYALGHGCFLHL